MLRNTAVVGGEASRNKEAASLEGETGETYMVGNSAVMHDIYAMIRKFARSDAPVLVTGESGTGKELVAKAIHERSSYAKGPFVAINCGGIPSDLIASELFGYERGAFTGATQRKIGRIESAAGGTVFLDEIGDLPLELQPHLLRFLQESTIDRVGGRVPTYVDVRVVAATNVDLAQAVRDGRFREDLYYRLDVLNVHLPALRERGGDLRLLSQFFLRKFAEEMGLQHARYSEEAEAALHAYRWPGNVRELISRVRRAVVLMEGDTVEVADLGLPMEWPRGREEECQPARFMTDAAEPLNDPGNSQSAPASERRFALAPAQAEQPCDRVNARDGMSLKSAVDSYEASLVRDALERQGRNVKRAAEGLGVSRVTMYRLMGKHGIDTEQARRQEKQYS